MNTSSALSFQKENNLRIVQNQLPKIAVLPEEILKLSRDTYLKKDYKRLIRNDATKWLVEDLKSFLTMRELGMTNYKHFVAEFSRANINNSEDGFLRFWLQLTLMIDLAEDYHGASLNVLDRKGIFKICMYGKEMDITIHYAAHLVESERTPNPLIKFSIK